MAESHDFAKLLIELGAALVGLAVLARIAKRWGISSIPLYLIAGLAFGEGGVAPLKLSHSFISTGAEIGVLLLLFMLGLEYSGEELRSNLRAGISSGVLDFVMNFLPGLAAGLILGWKPLPAVFLGGVTWVSSSGIISKLLVELGRQSNPEMPQIVSVLVFEDLAMAVYLPVVAVLTAGGGPARIAIEVSIAISAVLVVLFVALRYGQRWSAAISHESDEIVLLTTFGTVLLVAGFAQKVQVSAAIGAFLVGIAVSGPIEEQSHRLLAPLRDLFAAVFFFFFGLQINPLKLTGVLPAALALAVVTAITKIATGYWASRGGGVDVRGRWRTGAALIARGEFSMVIAGLGVGLEPALGPLSAAYILLLAIAGPVVARFVR
jgi:monovalent cation:H+ antiporter-2, CPA2 family